MRCLLSLALLVGACGERNSAPVGRDFAFSGTAAFGEPGAADRVAPDVGEKMHVFVTFRGTGSYDGRDAKCPGLLYSGDFKAHYDGLVAFGADGSWRVDLPRRSVKFTTVDGCRTDDVEISRIDAVDVRGAIPPSGPACDRYARGKGGSDAQITAVRDACLRTGTSAIAAEFKSRPAGEIGQAPIELSFERLERTDGTVIREDFPSM